jgi:hypothetical protein
MTVRVLVGFGRFWWEFIIGEDWRIAAGVAVVLGAGALLTAQASLDERVIALFVAAGIVAVAIGSIAATALAAARRRDDDRYGR